jgi:hypothetical protein
VSRRSRKRSVGPGAFAIVLAALLALAAAAGSVPGRSSVRQQTALAPLDAVNRLLAEPWQGGLRQQHEFETEEAIERSLEGKELAGGGGSVGISYRGVGVRARWDFGLRTKNVNAEVDLAAAPGFRSASLNGFALDAPRGGFWNFGFSSDLEAHASVRAAGNKIFSWSPSIPLGFRVSNFRISASAELDATQSDRPLLVRATISPSLRFGGNGPFPNAIPISFRTEIARGRVTLTGRVTNLSLGLPGIDARLTGDVFLTLFPSHYVADLELDLRQEILGVPAGDVINLSSAFQLARIGFSGDLSVAIKYVGTQRVPFSLRFNTLLPSTDELNEALLFLQPPLPKRWGEEVRPPSSPVPDVAGFDTAAQEIENAVDEHMPHGGVLAFDFDRLTPPPLTYTYGVSADSAIWTGHYLAAESFRYAKTQSADALARVKFAVGGLKRMFDVTTDAAVSGRRYVAVTGGPGIFSRTARPSDDPVNYTPGRPGETTAGPLESRPCHYVAPERGWSADDRTYRSFAQIPLALRLGRLGQTKIRPLGRVWYGWGCGNNHPVSRDQYVGVFMGLAFAHQLVPDPEVRATTQRLIEDALDFLLRNNWNVRLPPNNRIETNFMGDFPKQLAFLRIGKSVNPAKYGARYDDVAAAAELAWISVWFSSLDPLFQYYKFNLTHAAFGPALFLETDAATRARWMTSYRVLWRAVRHHRNAWFDLLRVLVHTPAERPSIAGAPTNPNASVSLSDEVKILLGEWLRKRDSTTGPNGLPLNRVAEAAPQMALWPNDIGRYTAIEGTRSCLARYPLPMYGRIGKGMDFSWQRHPFSLSVGDAGCEPTTPPSATQILGNGAPAQPGDLDHRLREGPAVDFLLPYWLGAYLGVLPGPAAPMPSPTPPPPESEPAPPSTNEAPTLAAGRVAASPRAPRAGRALAISVRVSRGGRDVAAAKVRCSARVGTRVVRLQSKRFVRSVARCTWRVPPGTSGRPIAGSIRVEVERATITRRFAVRVR